MGKPTQINQGEKKKKVEGELLLVCSGAKYVAERASDISHGQEMPGGVLHPEDSSANTAGEQVLLPIRCPGEEAGTCVLPGSDTRLVGSGDRWSKSKRAYKLLEPKRVAREFNEH